jgi:hypothetical protein
MNDDWKTYGISINTGFEGNVQSVMATVPDTRRKFIKSDGNFSETFQLGLKHNQPL